MSLGFGCLYTHAKAAAVGKHVLVAVFLPHSLADLSVTVSISIIASGYMQVLIAGAVLAGGYIVYSMIQQDPEARRALRDAKGKLRLGTRSGSGLVCRCWLKTGGLLLQVKSRVRGTMLRARQTSPTVRPRAEQRRPPTRLEQ